MRRSLMIKNHLAIEEEERKQEERRLKEAEAAEQFLALKSAKLEAIPEDDEISYEKHKEEKETLRGGE